MPKNYSVNLTFSEHKAVLQLLHNALLDAGQGGSDDPESLPLHQSAYRKYSDAFGKTDMFQDL